MKTEMLIELYDVARLMRTRFDRWARTYGMTRAQGVILARLARQPGMTQNEMAGLCEVEPITVGRLGDRLGGGALRGRPHPRGGVGRPAGGEGAVGAPDGSVRPPHPPAASFARSRADP